MLARRVAVGDDAGTGLDVDGVPLHDHRANGDTGVHAAIVAEVADRAGVEAAPFPFQRLDDLHCLDFGRAADRAGRKRSPHQVIRIHARL